MCILLHTAICGLGLEHFRLGLGLATDGLGLGLDLGLGLGTAGLDYKSGLCNAILLFVGKLLLLLLLLLRL